MMEAFFEEIRNWCARHDCVVSFRWNEHGEIEMNVSRGCRCKTEIIKRHEHPDENVLRFLIARMIEENDKQNIDDVAYDKFVARPL